MGRGAPGPAGRCGADTPAGIGALGPERTCPGRVAPGTAVGMGRAAGGAGRPGPAGLGVGVPGATGGRATLAPGSTLGRTGAGAEGAGAAGALA